jgi:hypothetical protein
MRVRVRPHIYLSVSQSVREAHVFHPQQYLVAHQQAATRIVDQQTGHIAKLDGLGAAAVAAKFEHERAGWPGERGGGIIHMQMSGGGGGVGGGGGE